MKTSALNRILLVVVAALCLLDGHIVTADQGDQDDAAAADEDNNDNGEDQQQQDEGQQDEAANDEDNGDNAADNADQQDGSVSFSVCENSPIVVQDMSILCDSPGTYYYGGNKYRASESCKPGDKARLYVDFYVQDNDAVLAAEDGIFVTLVAESFTSEGEQIVYEHASLCDLSTLSSLDGSDCGGAGQFRLSTHFYWRNDSSDGSSTNNADGTSFYPQMTIGFKTDIANNEFDLGGANTNLCTGNYFSNWKEGVRKTYSTTMGKIIISFGILVATAIVLACVAFYLVKRANNPTVTVNMSGKKVVPSSDSDTKNHKLVDSGDDSADKQQIWDDEFKKVKLLAQKDVLDF
uniref:Uncharacterized protein n=1 Tax=Craspedostauros australis TaxID=1486917 RepID=A0A7R9WTH9_9STRA|mmetsp:Transcript_17145/g.47480  ORF Transcript_17145/g.47480 Transcript_17145/m.47480 type:complete len:350 (+) Transcript_17145:144-1193(+)|eukprot:CAMPEP_0198114900 /NCGR_PEP_ID=MMETSP1442-20131203/6148_1 /TAXON_ID= /ORGANISM="Craspedostauros australis, Strain CCMP3328" /LENGTH=349 /DNA_ID=CAMNT_0043772309 /DNA_START=111 /DNA_END=1160 /DNA_ORIENTATION=+